MRHMCVYYSIPPSDKDDHMRWKIVGCVTANAVRQKQVSPHDSSFLRRRWLNKVMEKTETEEGTGQQMSTF